MPPLPSTRNRQLAIRREAWAEFYSPREWRRSAKSNLWRRWGNTTITVFYRCDGRDAGKYCWSVSSPDFETQFGPEAYDTEDEASDALGDYLGVGDV